MTLEEAKVELEKFVKLKTSMRPAFVQPLLDAVEQKHGHWITWFENKDVRQAKCSECGMLFTLGKGRDIHYCGNCGAKMDEVETNE